MSMTKAKKIKQTPTQQTENKQRITQVKTRDKQWSERQKARHILFENQLTTQSTQVVVVPQQAIPVTVATPLPL